MITTVTGKNMVTIPADIGRRLGIRPGWRLDWRQGDRPDQLVVRVIPSRGEAARRLEGVGRGSVPAGADVIAELEDERAAEEDAAEPAS